MTQYYLWLLQFMGAANPRSVQLIKHYGSAEAVYEAFQTDGCNPRFLKSSETAALKTASLDNSREIMQICANNHYRIVTLEDADYPVALKNIYNPPILLFVSGDLLREELCLAVVGTRNACDYSFKITKKLCTRLAREKVTIVSGMAIGIDKTAHTAAVEVKGRTIGVLACGFMVDYPRFSTPFRQEIINTGGAVISELLPFQRGERGYFNYRNRIMSGLSRGVLLIEAAEKSGCHITAAHAINQNRDIFCLPPSDIYNPRFRGVIGYLRDGAIPVFDHGDILNEYLIKSAPVEPDLEYGDGHTNEDYSEDKPIKVKSSVSANSPKTKPFNITPQKPPEPDLSELSEETRRIAELLKDGAKTVDFLAEKSGFMADELSDYLLELEIDGIIESGAGSSYKLMNHV
ncbi:MAG: DNA-processing protein DprA [Oscillospiraceae bacterium]|nr:DNA-processing protein DprA [Oscillospiraceae bacterium]